MTHGHFFNANSWVLFLCLCTGDSRGRSHDGSPSWECDTAGTLWGICFTFDTNIHLDSNMNRAEFVCDLTKQHDISRKRIKWWSYIARRSKVSFTVTSSCFLAVYTRTVVTSARSSFRWVWTDMDGNCSLSWIFKSVLIVWAAFLLMLDQFPAHKYNHFFHFTLPVKTL